MTKWTLFSSALEQWTRLPPPVPSDLSKKTVMVTGANTGIGLATAKLFAGMHPQRLIIACRNEQKGKAALDAIAKETGYTKTELHLLDLASFASVVAFAEKFKNEPLDILVANAAVATPTYETTSDGWESTLQVNHVATSLLVLLLTPTMVRTGQANGTNSRLVVVSSDTHLWCKWDEELLDAPKILHKLNDKDYCTPQVMGTRYPDSKLLNVFFVRALAERLPRSLPIVPTVVNPGYCHSELRRNINTLAMRVRFAIMDLLLARTEEQGAYQLVWAALGPDGKSGSHEHFLRGGYVSTLSVKEPSDFAMSKEGKEAQDKIWDETVEILSRVTLQVSESGGLFNPAD